MSQVNQKRKKADPLRKLSDEELINLANEIRKNELIWDLTNPLHKKADQVTTGWLKVSKAVNLTVEKCKKNWKSLKDKLRYRQIGPSREVKHSGDSGGELVESNDLWNDDGNETRMEGWKFAEALSFIIEKPYKRTTLSNELDIELENLGQYDSQPSPLSSEPPTPSPSTSSTSGFCSGKSNYEYSKKRRVEDSTNKLISTVTDLISVRKGSKTDTSAEVKKMKHETMLANLDRMLSKLPEDVVEDLNCEFIRLTHEKLIEQRNASVVILGDDDLTLY